MREFNFFDPAADLIESILSWIVQVLRIRRFKFT